MSADDAQRALRPALAVELAAAAGALRAMLEGRALPAAIGEACARARLTAASQAAVQDIAYGAARHLGTCRGLARRLNQRAPAPALAALQLVALSQLLVPGRRHEAVLVDQSVEAARGDPGMRAAAPFLNATLRRFLREREALIAALAGDPEAVWNHPAWWIERVRADHPAHWQAILTAGNQPPPMTLRVNRRRCTVGDYLARLRAAGLDGDVIGPQAVRLTQPCDVSRLPGFADGVVSVQDLAAQMAAPLLDVAPGMHVRDACAAPGGKTGHLLELVDCSVVAVDSDAARLARVDAGLARLGLSAQTVHADVGRTADWWDGRPFDRILLDAPCSASGIVRRHPDVRWLRRRSDLATLSRRQGELLERLWPLLAPGGKLLFATCSVFRAEGEDVVQRFAAGHPDAERVALGWVWQGQTRSGPIGHLLQQAGEMRDHDGFFYGSLRKLD